MKTPPTSTTTGITLVTLSALIWGMGGLFTRLLPFDLWTIVFWRGVFAVAFIGTYAWHRFGKELPSLVATAGAPGFATALSLAATIVLFPAAFQHTSVANAFMIMAAMPFIAAFLSWIWHGERPSTLTMIASLVALLGVSIMVGPTSGTGRFGDALALLGTATQALALVIVRSHPNVKMLPMVWLSVVITVIVSWPLAEQIGALGARDYLVAAGFALGPMTLGMIFFVAGSAMIPAALAALISVSEGPFGALWAWTGLGEAPPATTVVGGGIVLAAVVTRLLLEKDEA